MKTPRIISGPHGRPALCASDLLELASATNPNVHTPIGIGSWIIDDDTDGVRALEDADAAVGWQVDGILMEDGVTPKRNQYLTAEEANSGNYKLAVFPLGGCELVLEEDGVGGNISDAAIAATPYVDIVVTAPDDYGEAEKNEMGVGKAHANIKIDSSSVNAATTGKVLQLLGVADVGNVLDSTAKRSFRCKVIDSIAQAVQP